MKDLDSTWVVQKYGGTSLGKLLDKITKEIIPSSLEHDRVAVVCSARSGTSKSTGTTKLLLEAISHATDPSEGSGERLDNVVSMIRDQHLEAVISAFGDGSRVSGGRPAQELELSIIAECERLRTFLHAAQTIGELSPRSQDRVLALGEKLACLITASSLEQSGVGAKVVLLDDIVEQAYKNDPNGPEAAYEELGTHFFDRISIKIGERIQQCGDKVPVVTGFFGAMPHSLLNSVGRGYSDFCAAMCAVGIGAREVQIWKEVDGIFTTDPSKVPSARLLATVTCEEAAELTYFGSEVIHPLTMEHIQRAKIPLRLKNVKNPSGAGTIIFPSNYPASSVSTASNKISSADQSGISTPTPSFLLANGYHGDMQQRRRPTAVTSKDSILIINVLCHRNNKSHGFLAEVFRRLDQHKVVVDLITTTEKSISLAVSSATEKAREIKKATSEIEKLGTVSVTRGMSIISVVGHKMRNTVGIAGEIFSTLAGAKINIYLISQGASEINISFVVKESDALLAMNVVHTKVLQIPAHSEQENSFSKGPWLY